jgi:acyl-[acyl-carrier-protein]-phospholipid O-acyltransferase/long-chain-fatty-acid--[acyl-carrier-protein] ligase
MKNNQNLLKSQRFLPLFLTQFLGAFNDNVFKNAFVIWVTYDIAQKVEIDIQVIIALASALFIIPFLLFSAFAGQIADKYERTNLIKIIKTVEIIIMAFCFVGFYFESIYFLLFLLFLMGIHSTFFGPIKYSLLPEHLENKELIAGNALIEGGTFLAILLGTIFGGLIIRRHFGVEIICCAVLLFAVIGLICSVFIPKSKISDSKLKINFNIIAQTLNIINHAKKERVVWLVIIGISWFWFVGITFLSQFPTYVKTIIKGDEFIVTLFLTIFSIGIGVGSFICNKLQKGKINARFVPLGSIGITVGIIIFTVASYFFNLENNCPNLLNFREFISCGAFSYLIILGLFIIAISCGIYIVPLCAIMQHRSEGQYLSRIIAANNVMNALFMVLASAAVIILLMLKFIILEIFLMVGIANILVFIMILILVKIDAQFISNK